MEKLFLSNKAMKLVSISMLQIQIILWPSLDWKIPNLCYTSITKCTNPTMVNSHPRVKVFLKVLMFLKLILYSPPPLDNNHPQHPRIKMFISRFPWNVDIMLFLVWIGSTIATKPMISIKPLQPWLLQIRQHILVSCLTWHPIYVIWRIYDHIMVMIMSFC